MVKTTQTSPTPEQMQAIVDEIVGHLVDAGISYCFLRNRDLIPSGLLRWSDLDILVSRDVTQDRLVDIMQDLHPVQVVPFRDGLTYMFFPVGTMFLRVDFFHGEEGWMGAPFMDVDDVLTHRWNDHGLMVAAPLHQAYLTWCTRLVRGGAIPERYQGLIAHAANDHPQAFHDLFACVAGNDFAEMLATIARSSNWSEAPTLAGEFKRRLWTRAVLHRPRATLLASVRHLRHGIRRRLHPPGMDIALLCADPGTASSLARWLVSSPSRRIPGSYVEYRRWDHPPIHSFMLDVTDISSAAGSAHGSRHSIAWLFGLVMRRWMDRVIRDRGKLARMAFIVRERELMQLPFDPGLFGYSRPAFLARLAAMTTPKPDLLVVVDIPGEQIEDLRSGMPPEQAMRLSCSYRELAGSHSYGKLINGTQPFEATQAAVVSAIAEAVRERYMAQQGTRYA